MKKVTKAELLDCACKHHTLINTHWPKFRKKLSMLEIVLLAQKHSVKPIEIQYIVYVLDLEHWLMLGDVGDEVDLSSVFNKPEFYDEIIKVYS